MRGSWGCSARCATGARASCFVVGRSGFNNRHSGTIPSELAALQRLQLLYVVTAVLLLLLWRGGLVVCDRASQAMAFTSSFRRRLNHNQLHGTIPVQLARLESLRTL